MQLVEINTLCRLRIENRQHPPQVTLLKPISMLFNLKDKRMYFQCWVLFLGTSIQSRTTSCRLSVLWLLSLLLMHPHLSLYSPACTENNFLFRPKDSCLKGLDQKIIQKKWLEIAFIQKVFQELASLDVKHPRHVLPSSLVKENIYDRI